MKFTKMHGSGNDYVYVNCFEETIEQPEQFAVSISDRHTGIGSDGLVLIMPSETCDFRMRMFNSDGSEAQMCGNASRCVGKFVYEKGLTGKSTLSLETKAGVKYLTLYPDPSGKVSKVSVDMGIPYLNPSAIPVKLSGLQEPVKAGPDKLVNFPLAVESKTYYITCVSMGNPHCIIFTEDIQNIPLEKEGKSIENHPFFPEKTNIEFVKIIHSGRARMRVWERGTGETQACGTGACAVLVAGVLNNLLDKKAIIELPGGELEIEWREDGKICMTGDAVEVFEGYLEMPA